MRKTWRGWILLAMALLAAGCEGNDPRLARLAQESLESQAQQNQQLAAQHQNITRASRQLIESAASSRTEFHELNRSLAQQRMHLDQVRQQLTDDQRQLIEAERRDPVVASAILQIGVLAMSLLPLVVCIYVLRTIQASADPAHAQALSDFLVQELTATQFSVFPSTAIPSTVEHTPVSSLPAPPVA